MISSQRLVRAIPTVTRASDPFRRYNPEPSHEVRQADITGMEIEQLRARREMLRSQDPELAKTVIEVAGIMNVFEALELAKREGKLIVPNYVHDRILTETRNTEFHKQLYRYAAWTGTLIIYEAPDKPFGEEVVFENNYGHVKYSISFIVPEQFRGKANCALVVEHPDFELVNLGINRYPDPPKKVGSIYSQPNDQKIIVGCEYELKVDGENVHQVENFAKESDTWYDYDKRFRIPINKPFKEHARKLWRCNSYIGLLARSVADFSFSNIGANDDLGREIGVILF